MPTYHINASNEANIQTVKNLILLYYIIILFVIVYFLSVSTPDETHFNMALSFKSYDCSGHCVTRLSQIVPT